MLRIVEQLKSNRRLATALSIGLLLVLFCWIESRAVASKLDSHRSLRRQMARMENDSQAIQFLRSARRLATDRERPNDELLAEVKRAMEFAGISEQRWVRNDPAPPVRVPDSPYKKIQARLSFESVTLKQIISFVYDLVENNSALSLSNAILSKSQGQLKGTWDTELTLSYLIYAPIEQQPR